MRKALLSLAVCAAWLVCLGPSAKGTQPVKGRYKGCNVIVILVDALRPDRLACYGYPQVTAPGIEEIAREGVVFRNAFSPSSLTIESTTSIMTSLFPYSHGVFAVFSDEVPRKVYTMAQVFKIHGYQTAWFGGTDDPQSGNAKGQMRGFEVCDDFQSDGKRAVDWVKEHAGGPRPFFMMVHAYNLHELNFYNRTFSNRFYERIPAAARKKFLDLDRTGWERIREHFRNDRSIVYFKLGEDWARRHAAIFGLDLDMKSILTRYRFDRPTQYKLYGLAGDGVRESLIALSRSDLRSFRDLSDAALYDFDEVFVRPLIETLKNSGVYDRTVIVVIADHGNEFREHGYVGHGGSLYEESVRVPLIFRLPGIGRGRRIDELAASVDIMPTVLDLAGIAVPAQAQGISLAGVIEGAPGAARNRYVFGQSIDSALSIRSREWHLIRWFGKEKPGTDELYNVRRDPLETRNLVKERPDVFDTLNRAMADKYDSLPVLREETNGFDPAVDEAVRERIRKTGYW